jgi:hypothetical protein
MGPGPNYRGHVIQAAEHSLDTFAALKSRWGFGFFCSAA